MSTSLLDKWKFMTENTVVLFVTHYFINDLRKATAAPDERMYGLYATFIKRPIENE